MKIKSIKVLNDGLSSSVAERVWEKTEANANYQFNRSHACEYALISYWTMWLRVRYPAEYFAACMSIVKDDKLPGLVKDARECGIEILPPDVNLSTDRFIIPDSKHILAPFSAVKGVSEATARSIMALRERNRSWRHVRDKKKRDGTVEPVYELDETAPLKKRFDSYEEFVMAASQTGSKVNSAVVERLRNVGAFASIEPGSLPARHLDRRKAQTELLPGLIIDTVKADRQTDVADPFVRTKIIKIVREYKACEGCSLAASPHPAVRMKSSVKFMVVSDCPTWEEEKGDKLMVGEASDWVKAAIKDAGLNVADGYYTTLVKARKSEKFLTNEQLNGCRKFIEQELEVIKPAVIVALGSASIKYFMPGLKGSTAELAGKAFYDPAREATIICGINAQQLNFDPSKATVLGETFSKLAETVL